MSFRTTPIRLAVCMGLGVAVLACTQTACRPKAVSEKSESLGESTSARVAEVKDAAIVEPVMIPLEHLGVKDAQQADSIADAWSVEMFSAAADKQLIKLKKLLHGNQQITEADIRGVVAADFQCGRLTAQEFDVVHDDGEIRVQRPMSPQRAADTFQRGPGFVAALSQLQALVNNSSRRNASFKIAAVQDAVQDAIQDAIQDADRIESTIEFQLVGESTHGITQHASRWLCTWETGDVSNLPRLQSIVVQDEELTSRQGSALFVDRTTAVLGKNDAYHKQLAHGLDYWLDRLEMRFGINSSGWQGIAVEDVNGDGLDDVFICQPGGLPNRLFVQHIDGTAEDVSATAGLDYWDHSHAALFLDLDGDDDQDLVLATALGLLFFSNDGGGRFSVETAKLCPEAMPFTLAAADYDQDGDLDIYASCYSPRGKAIATEFLARPVPYHDANNGGRNCLFRNDGNWTYQNVTREVGLDANNRRFSLAASWEDYDNDGDQDLYVANDYGRNNLYRNNQGRFTDVALAAGVEDISAGMSVSWSDYNQDGQMDLYVSNMWSSAGNRITYQRQFHPATPESVRADFQRHARGNSLFMNLGDGSFRDVSVEADVSMGRWAWCSQFADVNNDSRDDLLVANGFITQDDTRDL